MSATHHKAPAGWGDPPGEVSPVGPGRTDDRTDGRAADRADDRTHDPDHDSGRNALQALLAFACIHEQAARRRALRDPAAPAETSPASSRDEFGLDEVLQLVAARAISITGAEGVAIGLAGENAIVCRASVGRIAPDPGIKLDPNSGFSGACLRSGQTVRCDDSDADSRVNAQACRKLGARSMIAVPLSARKRVVGLLEAFSAETFGFNDRDVRSLNLLGELILAAIRPEEEDRLAELAKAVGVPPAVLPQAEPTQDFMTDVIAAIPNLSARVIVDEKFAPLPKDPAPAQTAIEIESLPEATAEPEPHLAADVLPDDVPPFALLGETRKERFVSPLLLTVAVVLVVIGLGAATVWKATRAEPSLSADNEAAPSAIQNDLNAPIAPAPQLPAPEAKTSAISKVTGLHHSSSETASTVVIDLENQVQYEEHTLDNPARIYFDLLDTRMATGSHVEDIEVNDAFLKRIRMAQPADGVTRVVLETKADSAPSVGFDLNPYRLTIEFHKPAAAATSPALKTPPVALPKPSPAITTTPKKAADSRSTSMNPADFQIVLDAGHGGWDLGTVGRKGLLEKDLVLDIVQRLGKLIEAKLGAQVIYTRQDDSYLPLEKRAEIANVAKADMFLSVHANYSDLATARGVETYYTTTYSSIKARTDSDDPSLKNVDWTGVDIRSKVTDSHHLAADIQQSLYGGLAADNPEIRNRGVKEAQYVVLTGTQMPAVLAEVSFVSSPADETRLENSAYRQQIAEALYRGVAQYHREITHTKLASAKKSPH